MDTNTILQKHLRAAVLGDASSIHWLKKHKHVEVELGEVLSYVLKPPRVIDTGQPPVKRVRKPRRDQLKPCSVYLFTVGTSHKVGVSKNTPQRMADLQTAQAETIQEHTVIHCATRKDACKLERACHRRFKEYRASGEWFKGIDCETIADWLQANRP